MQRRIGFWLAAIVAFLCFCLPASADVMLPQYSVSVDGTVDVTEVAPGMIRLNLDPTSWLSSQFYILSHLAYILGP